MKSVTVENLKCFNLARTLLCGQCFRFEEIENGKFEIIAKCKKIVASQKGDCLILEGIDREEYESYFRDYFDIDRDYETLDKLLCTDKTLRLASPYSKGIHILKQEPFETLCSFIISQNNNIPRIKGIISRLCELLGDEIEAGVNIPQHNKSYI